MKNTGTLTERRKFARAAIKRAQAARDNRLQLGTTVTVSGTTWTKVAQ